MLDLEGILERYGIVAASLEPLGDTQNANHMVAAASGERFLLRQHRSEHLSLNMLESELLWLSDLHRRALEVQRPVTLPSGKFILLDDERRFSLLSWLEGEVHQVLNEAQGQAAGALLTRLHLAARAFAPPVGFERPAYDQGHLARVLATLRGLECLTPDLPLLERAALSAVPAFADPVARHLIHADLHPGNLVWRGSKVAAIDFDACGFGPLGFDLASALGSLEAGPRAALLHGYERVSPLPTDVEAHRSAYTIAAALTNLTFLAAREHERGFLDTVMLPELRQQLPELLKGR
ncbi:phosphotransferase enzyme family protein [Deinococcus alpinitundrae]|uniref:phosphotransferase enzyme family protein n=1 Tax=Deinococcus alpinitundrae TaxID=468913 RepID=UPI00137A3E01|nr:phosphotransferase [Deinococcus alpinitundrae]